MQTFLLPIGKAVICSYRPIGTIRGKKRFHFFSFRRNVSYERSDCKRPCSINSCPLQAGDRSGMPISFKLAEAGAGLS